MTRSAEWLSGKGRKDENFPVASVLVAKRHRPAIVAFYRFARAADDAADHPDLAPAEKRAILDRLEATLLGRDDAAEALPLREALAELGMAPTHALDLLVAFRQDVDKSRYATMDELIDYCAHSAAPVGRFVLDVHGESRATWPAADALSTSLQIINHVQDCAKDLAAIDRVYIPQDILARHGATTDDLTAGRATPALRQALAEVTARARTLLGESAKLAPSVRDWRLRMEIAVIRGLAARILTRLERHDPLGERVHLTRTEMATGALRAAVRQGFRPSAAGRAKPLGEGT